MPSLLQHGLTKYENSLKCLFLQEIFTRDSKKMLANTAVYDWYSLFEGDRNPNVD